MELTQPTMTLWTHALAALLFGTLALMRLRHDGGGLPRITFVVALAATALWALAVAGIDARDVATRVAESIRNLAWLAFLFAMLRRDHAASSRAWVTAVYAATALVFIGAAILSVAGAMTAEPVARLAISSARIAIRMLGAVGGLILVHHLQSHARDDNRGGLRMAALALTLMWSVDLAIYVAGWASGRWPGGLVDARGVALIAVAPMLGIAVQKDGAWSLQLSRTVAFQALTVIVIGLYVAVTGVAAALLAEFGGQNARLVQTAFVFGTTAALLTIVSTPWLRAWAKVMVAKHLFRHRYDYRSEWLRFTETLGTPGGDAALDVRVVKAIADLTDSPGGLLLDGAALDSGAGWNWDGTAEAGGEPLAQHLAATRRIIELDAVRAGTADAGDIAAVPGWLRDRADAWAVVPLAHIDRLAGAIVLTRPPVDRALDWEDFDLLGVAGRQAASYLAEDRAHDALADAQRFDEFNRRFAFIMHDLKNLVSQLTLVARNAERHADNPEFRADMVATLKDSADRMNHLLARLSQHHNGRAEPVRAVALLELAERVADSRRAQHRVVAEGDATAVAVADPTALETLLGHLVQNAIEASASDAPVTISVRGDAGAVCVAVSDRGCGMSPGFVRDRLFRPFTSSKPGGFGLGAFEARQLAEAMGGRLSVESREGDGTVFTVTLRASNNVAEAA
ncbi:PEP-CTERM system histidine kinase PrsK [Sphingomonas sp. SUN019]|uniref:XrtA/PEP-CTERM system histidine kinase PrsK n=1 Tax=Sphingomonas sp. SUN019 TaxID=2937788 RepID=UPI002164C4EB|nr:XrtA/PEP-CTERM system histidine kinase PrsK [Sphingomonas sp. SUN019]UVO51966.1 PEP-CTERM system histidine kinase PrsK [Sphingomonas sp. SUN019]